MNQNLIYYSEVENKFYESEFDILMNTLKYKMFTKV